MLDHFSFKAPVGRHTVFKGESGSGKSTILKLLLGFYQPDSGHIAYNDQDWTPRNLRRNTAWLPQDLNLGNGTVSQVMAKPFDFALNNSRQSSRSKQAGALKQLGLPDDILSQPFRTLSTGQRQRVGAATCFLLDKPLLLLDEPTSALDKSSKQRIIQLLLAHTNRTVLSTSHDPYWVEQADITINL